MAYVVNNSLSQHTPAESKPTVSGIFYHLFSLSNSLYSLINSSISVVSNQESVHAFDFVAFHFSETIGLSISKLLILFFLFATLR